MFSKSILSLLVVLLCAQSIFGLTIVTRSQWGARSAKSKSTLANSLSYAIIHHTEGAACSTDSACVTQMKNIQNYHMDSKGWSDIGYNFLIGGNGKVYEGRGWNTVGAHCTNWNSKSLGISFIGTFHSSKPNSAQLTAAKELLAMAVSRGQIKSGYIMHGHRQVGSTDCPGNALYNEIKTWKNWKA